MQLGMVGLGRMGANMVRRLMKAGHECVVFDRSPQADILEQRISQIEIEMAEVVIRRYRHADAAELRQFGIERRIRVEPRVGLTGAQPVDDLRIAADERHDDLVELRTSAPVVGVRGERDVVAAHPVDDRERS